MYKISIIITARNYAQYLTECIKSCLNQTVKPYEIIYSDDYSTDNSLEIAKSFHIKTFEHAEHVGVVNARNDGANVSEGDYLIFLDGDDYLEKDYLERMIDVLDNESILIYSSIRKIDSGNNNLINVNAERNEFLWKQNFINTSALIRKKEFIRCGKWQENKYNTHWDWHLYMRLSRYGKFKKSSAVLNYRQHSDSNLNQVRKKYNSQLSEVRRNIMLSIVNVTIGLIYSGRIKNFIYIWMDDLTKDINVLHNKPQLIIINNSSEILDLSKYSSFYSEIKVIKGNDFQMRTKETRPLLSKVLADGYNTILENAIGEIVHLREDDNLSEKDSFKQIFDYLTIKENNVVATAGLYMSRHQKRIIGGYYKNDKTNLIEKLDSVAPVQIDFTGTGYIMFWKDLVPKYLAKTELGELSHDWAWSMALKKTGKRMFLIPTAMSRHYLDEERYILPDSNNITPLNNFTKKTISNTNNKLIKKKII